MIPKNRITPHPGELLQELFLDEMGLSQADLARHTGMPTQRVNEICVGKRGISAETAWLLAGALGTSPEFWTNAQALHELTKARPEKQIPRIKVAA